MPRYRRRIVPGSVQHLISRFVNGQFVLDAPGARARCLTYAARAFERCDWSALGYALMSSHVHWVVRAGEAPSDRLIRGLHAGFAGWINRTTDRLGPVFAERHRNVECSGETACGLLAYVHNNPVRAGVARGPADSDWTSHRAYIGLEEAPPWLDVAQGLRVCGFSGASTGRRAFHAFVAERRAEPRSGSFAAADLQAQRRTARKRLAGPVEVASPCVAGDSAHALELHVPVVVSSSSPRRASWTGDVLDVVRATARLNRVPEDLLRSRTRTHALSATRRLALLVWCHGLSRPAVEMTQALGIGASTASQHLARSTPAERDRATRLAASLQTRDAEGTDFGNSVRLTECRKRL
jgi:hypothetical protein